MTKIALTAAQIATLVGARAYPASRSAVKKELFASVRSQFGIPSSVKLSVEVDNRNDPLFGVLKDKASGYALLKNAYGRYVGVDRPVATTAPAVVQQQGSVTVANPASAVATPIVRKISRASLLQLLRNNTGHSVANTGSHPVLSNIDSVGLDNSNGDFFFRTR